MIVVAPCAESELGVVQDGFRLVDQPAVITAQGLLGGVQPRGRLDDFQAHLCLRSRYPRRIRLGGLLPADGFDCGACRSRAESVMTTPRPASI